MGLSANNERCVPTDVEKALALALAQDRQGLARQGFCRGRCLQPRPIKITEVLGGLARPKATATTMPPRTRKKEDVERETGDGRPTVADLEGESQFAQVAKKHWLGKKTAKVKVKLDVLKKEIWDVLEKEDFTFKSLLVLENLQILQSYLWPGYSEDSSNFHVLLVVLISNVRTREHLSTWGEWYSNA